MILKILSSYTHMLSTVSQSYLELNSGQVQKVFWYTDSFEILSC